MQTRLTNMHRLRCEAESTRDVIFLFQRRRYHLHGLPEGLDCQEDYVSIDDEAKFSEYVDSDPLEAVIPGVVKKMRDAGISLREFVKLGLEFGDWDHPCVTEEWLTEGVWLDREEAERYGKSRDYNYTDGWRVYGVCAEGDLAKIISGDSFVAESAMYYVQNVSAGYVGNNPQWWAKGGNGYTSYVDNAQEFTESEARKKLKEDRHKWRAWPVTVVQNNAYRTCEGQGLNLSQALS